MHNEFDINIFLSSTFNEDLMRQTRSAFRNEINARLNNLVGLLGGNAFVFDLQLGIPDGTGAMKTLQTCFDKIKESDFFVFILSEKSGSQNTRVFLLSDSMEQLQFDTMPYGDTIKKGVDDELFIIELEVLEAAKNPRLRGKRIFFFDKNADNPVRIRLQANIDESDIQKEFAGVDEIKQEFIAFFQKALSDQAAQLNEQQKNHNLFYAGMLRYYVENTKGISLLDVYFSSDSRKTLALVGTSGSGKSTLLADWVKDKTQAVVYHVGAKGRSLQEVLAELYQAHWPDLPEEVRSGDERKLKEQFSTFLQELVKTGVNLLVMDGLNQLELEQYDTEPLSWIPRELPDGVKLVFSTTQQAAGFEICEVPKVDLFEILRHILRLEGKELETDTIEQALAQAEFIDGQLPIMARLIYHEIVENFDYESIRNKLAEHLSTAGDVKTLYLRMIQRLEARIGKELVQSVLALLWSAKDGLRYEDLLAILKPQRPDVMGDMLNMLYHEFSRDYLGRLRFRHSHLTEAVRSLYADQTGQMRELILAHMDSAYDKEGQTWQLIEIAKQLYDIKDTTRMEAILSHAKAAFALYSHNPIMFAQYFRIVPRNEELPYIWEQGIDINDYSEVSFVAFYLQLSGDLLASRRWRTLALRLGTDLLGRNHYEIAKTNNAIGFTLQQVDQFDQALRYHMEALDICESLGGDAYGYTGMTCDEIGKDHLGAENFSEAKRWFDRAIKILESTPGTAHVYTARAYNDMLVLYQTLGDLAEAEKWGIRAVAAYEAADKSGFSNNETAAGYLNLAQIYAGQHKFDEAYSLAKKAAYCFSQLRRENDPFLQKVLAFEDQMLMLSH